MKYKATPFSDDEYHKLYGNPTIEIGKCFKVIDEYSTHYYMQRENDVLHVGGGIINTLHVSRLNDKENDQIEITNEEFNNHIRKTIYELELDKFWN